MTALTDVQIANIVFNETRSLSGPRIDEVRINVAHTIINAAASKHKFPKMAPSIAKPGPGEATIYSACTAAATQSRDDVTKGVDPTNGAEHFNFRDSGGQGPFQGHALTTSIGPLSNSYPTDDLPASGIYANTYE